MVPPFRSSAKPEFDTATNNLWVGNLTPDVTEAELTALFEKYGQVDSITSYSARSYAFLYFRSLEEAKAAKDALQGTVLRGNPLKIEFAKPAKPCKSLWVAGIGQSVSKEELEEHFKKFGKILEFKFIKDRNTTYIDYARLEDATEALKTMNGKQISGEQIRVDYLRSHPARREQGPDFAREGQFPYRNTLHTQDYVTAYSEPTHAGSKRPHAMKNSFLTELQNIKCTEDMAIKLQDLAMKRLKDRHNHLLQKKLEKSCASISDALTLLTEASAAVKLLDTDLNMIAEETKSALNLLRALLSPVDSGLNLSADPSVPLADSESKMKSNESSPDPSPDPAPAPAAKNEKTHPPTNAEEELRPSLNSYMNKRNDAVKLLDNMSEMDQTQDERAKKISAVIERISTLIWSLIVVRETLKYGLLD